MSRLHTAAAVLIAVTLATSGCARNRNLPTQMAPSKISTIGVNAYLWRAAVVCGRFIGDPQRREIQVRRRYRWSRSARKRVPLLNHIVLSRQQQAIESIPLMEPSGWTDYIDS